VSGATSVADDEEIADGDRLVAVWAEPAGSKSTGEGVAVRAALVAERAGLAGRALVDRGRRWRLRREQDRGHQLAGVAGSPGGLAAGVRAEASATGRGEAASADRAGHRSASYRDAIVTARAIRHGGPLVRPCVVETRG